MAKNNFGQIHKQAKEAAIKKVKKELEKQKEFYKIKKLEMLIKDGAI